ncbi:MAG: hypothetical protein JXX28_11425 [Deltaproteobacteria bacterium]|nr:hypothetical protein [Deltaproteobacteria bacterium]
MTLLITLLTLAQVALAGPRVAVIQSDDIAVYTDPVAPFLAALGEPASVYNLYGRRSEADALIEHLRWEEPDVVFALGAKAAWTVRHRMPYTPLVYAMVLQPERYGLDGSQVTGVMMRVFPETHLSNFVGFFPSVHKVGVFRLPDADPMYFQALRAGANEVGLNLVEIPVEGSKQVRRTLREIDDLDALWLQNDRDLVSPDSFRGLVEDTRRRRLPLLVESDNMVRAGGLFAVVPEPASIGGQSAKMVRRILDGASPAIIPVEPPEEVEVALNLRTLRASDLFLDELLLDFVDVLIE